MVLSKDRYNAAYFGDKVESGGLTDDAGYSDYLRVGEKYRFDEGQEGTLYNPILKDLITKAQMVSASPLSVLDVGGAVGFYSEYAKSLFNIGSWTVLDIADWCQRHKIASVDNYIVGDAVIRIPLMAPNSYDIIFSSQFLEVLTDAELAILIPSMNRVAKTKQVHIITDTANPTYYNRKTLAVWATLGFKKGTILIGHDSGQVLVV